ncbi:MAG: NADH-quinone oxidoreductase subunit N [Desulfococcaceae bacterium]
MNPISFGPELYTLALAGVFLLFSMLRPDPRRDYLVALSMTAAGIGVAVACLGVEDSLFHGAYRVDLFSQVFKTLLLMGLFLVVCLCSHLPGVDEKRHPEFYLLLSVCTLSMMMLAGSVHLLTLYIALELSSYSLYILVFLRREAPKSQPQRGYGVDAGIKYFLIGASASAVMLFGMALLYGTTGAMEVVRLMEIVPGKIGEPVVAAGLVMILCGFFFKLAVFPFHFWAADVYEGAANPVAAYVSTASKVAAIAVLVRVVALAGNGSDALAHVLVTLAIISMTVGNLSAIVQKDLKRLLAFSSVAHGGYVMIGVLAMTTAGYASAIFYALAVLLMKFTCFLVVVVVADDGRNIRVDELAGLHRRAPILALALMMALFGLAGVPPTIGFTGKLLVFLAAMNKGYLTLIIIAMINVVISLYYYLLVLRAAYLLEPETEPPPLRVTPGIRLLAGGLVAAMVVIGVYPTQLIEMAQSAARMLRFY